MALDRTNSIEWNDYCVTNQAPQLLECKEDRNDFNSTNGHRSESNEETRTIEPNISSTNSITASIKSRSSHTSSCQKSKNKLSLTSFLKKSEKKSASQSVQKSSSRSIKTSSERENDTLSVVSKKSTKSEIQSYVSKQSSRKSTNIQTQSHATKQCIEWEKISAKAVSIVNNSKSIKHNKEIACTAIIDAIATKSNVCSTLLVENLSEVAAIASNMVMESMDYNDEKALKDRKKLASYTVKAIMRAGTSFINDNDTASTTDASYSVHEVKSVTSHSTKKSTKSVFSENTQKSTKSVKTNTSRASSARNLKVSEITKNLPESNGKEVSSNVEENKTNRFESIAQFLNINDTSASDKLSSGNTVQSLFEKFNKWQNAADDTLTL